MRFSHFFIVRPIFATVLSLLIVIVGLISYFALPVAQFPEIVPPTISVSATYPGASATTVADTVASVIEQQVNGVEGMIYMYSQSTDSGNMSLRVTFEIGTDIDKAQVLVQNRVAEALPRLPEEVRRTGVSVNKRAPPRSIARHPPGLSRQYIRSSLHLQLHHLERRRRTGTHSRRRRRDTLRRTRIFDADMARSRTYSLARHDS